MWIIFFRTASASQTQQNVLITYVHTIGHVHPYAPMKIKWKKKSTDPWIDSCLKHRLCASARSLVSKWIRKCSERERDRQGDYYIARWVHATQRTDEIIPDNRFRLLFPDIPDPWPCGRVWLLWRRHSAGSLDTTFSLLIFHLGQRARERTAGARAFQLIDSDDRPSRYIKIAVDVGTIRSTRVKRK